MNRIFWWYSEIRDNLSMLDKKQNFKHLDFKDASE